MTQRHSLKWDGAKVKRRVRDGAVSGLTNAAEHLLEVSRAVVPLEEGTLERSGTASVDKGKLTAAVSYDTVYAVRQHEELTWKHAPGRQAKYLEGPADEFAPVHQALIAAGIRRASR